MRKNSLEYQSSLQKLKPDLVALNVPRVPQQLILFVTLSNNNQIHEKPKEGETEAEIETENSVKPEQAKSQVTATAASGLFGSHLINLVQFFKKKQRK